MKFGIIEGNGIGPELVQATKHVLAATGLSIEWVDIPVGESAVSYVRRLRLERAGRKLRMGAVDITEVARAAGYESHAAFSKAFKQQFGKISEDQEKNKQD